MESEMDNTYVQNGFFFGFQPNLTMMDVCHQAVFDQT